MDVVNMPSTGKAKDYDDVVVDGTAVGVVILPANPHRRSALITNIGADPMRVTTDGTPPTPTHGKRLVGGASLELPYPNSPTLEVRAIREGLANTTANVSEIT